MKTTIKLESDQLDKKDVRSLLQSIRLCEMATFQNKDIHIYVEVPELSTDEVTEIFKSIKPPFKYGPKIITLRSK